MKNRTAKITLITIAALLGALLVVILAAFLILHFRSAAIRNDVSSVFTDDKYKTPVAAEGIPLVTQEISCGYAVLEMFSGWSGHGTTEESLFEEYGKVVTSTGKAFCAEMNKQFPEYTTVMHKYLTNTQLIDQAYDCLSEGIPVPFEWAARFGDEWTLHYSLLTGMDIPNDRITVANPYGYYEELSVDAFLERTRFDAFEKMPLFLKLGFAFGVFEKNTVFSVH